MCCCKDGKHWRRTKTLENEQLFINYNDRSQPICDITTMPLCMIIALWTLLRKGTFPHMQNSAAWVMKKCGTRATERALRQDCTINVPSLSTKHPGLGKKLYTTKCMGGKGVFCKGTGFGGYVEWQTEQQQSFCMAGFPTASQPHPTVSGHPIRPPELFQKDFFKKISTRILVYY